MIGANEVEVKMRVKWEKIYNISDKRVMKATLALQQSGLRSAYIGFTLSCGELRKHKDIIRLQHAEYKSVPFHFTGTSTGEKSDGFIPVFPVCGCLTMEEQAGNF